MDPQSLLYDSNQPIFLDPDTVSMHAQFVYMQSVRGSLDRHGFCGGGIHKCLCAVRVFRDGCHLDPSRAVVNCATPSICMIGPSHKTLRTLRSSPLSGQRCGRAARKSAPPRRQGSERKLDLVGLGEVQPDAVGHDQTERRVARDPELRPEHQLRGRIERFVLVGFVGKGRVVDAAGL